MRALLRFGLVAALVASACTGAAPGKETDRSGGGVPDPPRPVTQCLPTAEYCNVGEESGIADVPRYGRGVSFADVDQDGDDDVFLADTNNRAHSPYGVSAIYLNAGDGRFERADVGLDEADLFATWGAAFGDYDNDGAPDLLITSGGFTAGSNVALYHNDMQSKKKFTRVTDTARIEEVLRQENWWGASWADYDGDGWEDFVVVPLSGRVRIMHNERDGTFSDQSDALGLTPAIFTANTPVWIDIDQDRDPDLLIPDNDLAQDRTRLYENRLKQGEGFVDVTAERIGAIWPDRTGGVFAAAAADFNQDGCDDLYLGRWWWQDLVLVNDCTGYFRAYGREVGLDQRTRYESPLEIPGSYTGDPSESENTMGLGVGNFDGDLPKVFIGTGNPKHPYADIVFCTKLDSQSPAGFRFERCSQNFVAGQGATWGHGVAFSDVDNNGSTDVVWNLGGHPELPDEGKPFIDARQWPSLFKSRKDGATATLKLVGMASGRDAFGAKVRTDTAGITRFDTVRCQQGFSSQNSHSLLVPVGATQTAEVTILWPAGGVTKLSVRAGEVYTVYEDGRWDAVGRAASR